MIKEIKHKRLKESIEKEFSISINTLKYLGVSFTLSGEGLKITIDCNVFGVVITNEMEEYCTDIIMKFMEKQKYRYTHIMIFYTR